MMTTLISMLVLHIILVLVLLVVLGANSVFGHAQGRDARTGFAAAAA